MTVISETEDLLYLLCPSPGVKAVRLRLPVKQGQPDQGSITEKVPVEKKYKSILLTGFPVIRRKAAA